MKVPSHWQIQIYFMFSAIWPIDFGWRYFIVRCFWSMAVINYTTSFDVVIDILFTFA